MYSSSSESSRSEDGGVRKKARTIKPLSKLSFHKVKKNLEQERTAIPTTAESRVASRRKELEERRARLDAEFSELEMEKETHVRELEADLEGKRAQALECAKSTGGPDMYCKRCNDYYKSLPETDNLCNFWKCRRHKTCPRCYDEYQLSSDSESENPRGKNKANSSSDSDSYSYDYDYYSGCEYKRRKRRNRHYPRKKGKKYEYDGWSDSSDNDDDPEEFYYDGVAIEKVASLTTPSAPGYVKCWICNLEFCEKHFPYHYRECRAKARSHCGFKPPSDYGPRGAPAKEGCVRVPGHCGRELQKNERYGYGDDDAYICCDTMTICWKCVSVCRRCGGNYCKVCAKEKRGCMGDSWKRHRCGPPEEDVDDSFPPGLRPDY